MRCRAWKRFWFGRERVRRHWFVTGALAVILPVSLPALAARAPGASQNARTRAFDLTYNLDRAPAQEILNDALNESPDDPSLHRSVASMVWLEILFQRGSISVDDYIGAISLQKVNLPAPAPPLARSFERHAQRAVDLARERLKRDPRSVDGLYELGAAEGLLTSYKATVKGQVLEALGDARRAYNAHERVLEFDSGRKDAGLVVGIYRYVIGSLSLPLRLMAYIVGFGGGQQRGLQMVEEAAGYASDAQAEALFALVLLYNRERRFDDALRVLAQLREAYPRNRLLWLESGATALRADRVEEADRWLAEGMRRLAADTRARAFGEEALWRQKRGAALLRLGQTGEATAQLRLALGGDARDWVRGRTHLDLGRLALLAGDRATARLEFDRAAELCGRDNDSASADEARRLKNTAKPD